MKEAAAKAEKCRGMKFAEQQLVRHGWEQGKGLGRSENGISEAIKVKVKCDKGGFGHKESEQFTFHWWDHVFNKASASLAVESGQNGVVVKKTEEKEEGAISNKKPRKAMMDKSALYGRFVKSATLLSGQEQPERSSSSSDDSSSEDDEKLDLSSAQKLSDAELMKACGGRTAHKGARHGLTMSAKLARLEQQEQEFMAKYSKKRQTDKTAQREVASPEPVLHQETMGQTTNKKAKKWRSHEQENGAKEDLTITGSLENHHTEESSKKQKKQSKDKAAESLEAFEDITKVCRSETKKKHKRSEKKVEESSMLDLDSTEPLQQCDEHQQTSGSGSKKKRKKKKCSERVTMEEEGQNENTLQGSTDTTECAGQEQPEEVSVELQPTCDSASKRKKKKKKSSKHNDSEHRVDGSSAEQSTEAENKAAAVEEERLQSKKRRQCRGVEQEEPLVKKKKEKCKA